MSLPRAFVGFSGADIRYYRTMQMWKAHDDNPFNFADFQIDEAIDSENEAYIKSRLRRKIVRSDTYALLIGDDTWTKATYVKWEVDVAIEAGCRLIGVNINNCRFPDALCPWFFKQKGALFVPFSSRIVAAALESSPANFDPPPGGGRAAWYYFYDRTYTALGYELRGDTATLPERLNPFRFGQRPDWAK